MKTIHPIAMKALEARYMEAHQVPGALLMEHAALAVCASIARYTAKGVVVFVCGPGNNGGDGYAAARLWKARGGQSHIIEITSDVHGDALLNRNLAVMANIPIRSEVDFAQTPMCEVIVDALFGTGFSRPADGFAARLIHWINDRGYFSKVPVIAVDVPSGLCGATGKVLGDECVDATETVTFHRVKQGLVLGEAPDYVGKITCAPLLTMEEDDDSWWEDDMDICFPGDFPSLMFTRSPSCHKGDFGRVVLFCGSPGMAGAAALCANAAIRTGAGLTTILCRESLLPILQVLAPGAMCTVLPEKDGQLLPEAVSIAGLALEKADAACIGCGVGLRDDATSAIVKLFAIAKCPVVWDADALTWLSRMPALLPLPSNCVLTPHPGEAARLLDCTPRQIEDDRLSALHDLHGKCGGTVLLKGARTLITDGENMACSVIGSPALAKGGSGDVLTGVITALLARRDLSLDGFHAAMYGAALHGLAGVRAAKIRGENCTQPAEVVDCIRLDAGGIE